MNCDPKALLAAAKCYQCVPKAVLGPTVISLLCEWANNMAKCTFQEGAGSPVGVNTPGFVGQLYHDTTNDEYWRSTGLTNSDWVFVGEGTPFVEWLPHTESAIWNDAGGLGQTGDYATFLANADLDSLSYLNLAGTAITSLVCNNCRNLTILYVQNCSGPLTTLDVGDCSSLTDLICAGNAITSLDLSECPSLVLLECSSNSLLSLDVTRCTGMRNLVCSTNSIPVLDISKNPSLRTLECSFNLLAALDVSAAPLLQNLSCDNNAIVTLDVTTCPSLENLYCGVNSLVTLNVTGCAALTVLDCHSNSLTTLDVSTCVTLGDLFCPGNNIATLNVLGCTSLGGVAGLDCSDNALTNGAGGSVNVVLSDMVTNNPPPGSITMNLQTPLAPPDAGPPNGAAAKATLIGLGWAVTTD